MPTTRPRHTLTETEPIARALTDAAVAWPELRGDRGALLRKLVEAGAATVQGGAGPAELVRHAAGAASGAYPRDARAELPGRVAGVIVLDANVLIGFLDDLDPHHEVAVELLERRFVEGFGTNVLTVAEALVHPTRTGRHDAALSALLNIGVRVIPLDGTEALHLAAVRNAYRIRMPDAVALHTAIVTGSELATFDDVLANAALGAGVTIAR